MVHVCKEKDCHHCARSNGKARRTMTISIDDAETLKVIGNGSKTRGIEKLLSQSGISSTIDSEKDTRVAFSLSGEDFIKLRHIGEGNASEGIRRLVYLFRKRNSVEYKVTHDNSNHRKDV